MLLQVHDELIFEVPLDEIETMKTLTREVMTTAVKLSRSAEGRDQDRTELGRDGIDKESPCLNFLKLKP